MQNKYPIDVITHDQRQTIRDRSGHFRVTSDFGRNYKCVDKYMASYRIEDWLHFVCVHSHYVFYGTLSPDLEKMWKLLQKAVMHYFGREPWTDDGSRAASDSMLKYASLMEEKKFPDKMFTINLHISCCQLPRQERERGAASRAIELVMERACGSFKSVIGRTTCRLVMANELNDNISLEHWITF
jgi:hypothetical protein